MPPTDVIWGIGTTKQSSPSMTMTTADARAKTAVARQPLDNGIIRDIVVPL